jgi:hypothetical protein
MTDYPAAAERGGATRRQMQAAAAGLVGALAAACSLPGGAYLQEREPPANKKAIVDGITAAKPMPRSLRWLDIDKVGVENLGKVREGTVSVRDGLADIDRRVTAIVQAKL